MSMTETEQERVWFAREVFSLFLKAFTNLKLYPHDHQYCVDAVAEFSKRLRAYTKLHDVLRIKVNQDTLEVAEQEVYSSESQKENLAFRLYVDGLRELSVARGVTHEEAVGLAHVFYKTVADPDADSTLLLWEADFKNIDYVAINNLTDAWESPDFFSAGQLDLLKEMNRDVDGIVESLSNADRERGAYSFELTDGASELESIEDLEDDSAEREESDGDIFDVHADALRQLQAEVASWSPDRLLETTVSQALDGLALAPDVLPREDIAWLLTESVDLALRSKDMELLGKLLGRFDGELQLVEDEDEQIFREVFRWLGREENLERLVKLSKGGALGGPKAFCRILALMDEAGLLAAVASFLETEDNELKEELQRFLLQHAGSKPQVLDALLSADRDAATVRAGLFVVSKVVRGDELNRQLKLARAHPDPEVKQYADHMWRTATGEGRVQVHMDALGAASRDDRVKALQALVKGRHREAVPRIKQVIESSEFVQRDVHERQAFIEALRYLGGTTAVAFLEQQASRKTLLFNRQAVKEIRSLAQKALDDLRSSRRK